MCIHSDLTPLFETGMSDSSYSEVIRSSRDASFSPMARLLPFGKISKTLQRFGRNDEKNERLYDISDLHLICDISLREAIQLSRTRALRIKALGKYQNLGDLGDLGEVTREEEEADDRPEPDCVSNSWK